MNRALAVLFGVSIGCLLASAAAKMAAIIALWGHTGAADVVGYVGLAVSALAGFCVTLSMWNI